MATVEAFNTACRVNNLHLARVERMAEIGDVDDEVRVGVPVLPLDGPVGTNG